jgi:hypothetical protein
MRAVWNEKKTYTRVGLLWGGFMFAATTTWDLYRRAPRPPVLAYLMIWPYAGYFIGLIYWKLAGEGNSERPLRDGWTGVTPQNPTLKLDLYWFGSFLGRMLRRIF